MARKEYVPAPFDLNDQRYKVADGQEFKDSDEVERFRREYCDNCRLERGCTILDTLQLAVFEGCAYWDVHFKKRELKEELSDKVSDLPSSFIACTQFKGKRIVKK